MQRVVLIAALKPGAREHALKLIESSAPSWEQEPAETRRRILLSDRDAVFYFERGDG